MNRRSILAGVAALLATPIGTRVATAAPARRGPIPHSELAGLWRAVETSRNLDALRDQVGNRFGPLPWVFTGAVLMGVEPDGSPRYEDATVRVTGLRQTQLDVVLMSPAIVVDFDIVEPARLSPGPGSRRIAYRGGW